jgi:hypothetical protein
VEPARPDLPGPLLAGPIVLHLVAAHLSTPQIRPLIAQWVRRDGRELIGFAFLAEGWQSAGYDGYRYGDLNTVPAMADAEVRAVIAVDVDERGYQLVRGQHPPPMSILTSPPPVFWQTNIPDALRQLVAAGRTR